MREYSLRLIHDRKDNWSHEGSSPSSRTKGVMVILNYNAVMKMLLHPF